MQVEQQLRACMDEQVRSNLLPVPNAQPLRPHLAHLITLCVILVFLLLWLTTASQLYRRDMDQRRARSITTSCGCFRSFRVRDGEVEVWDKCRCVDGDLPHALVSHVIKIQCRTRRVKELDRETSLWVLLASRNQGSVGPTWTYTNFWSGLMGSCLIFRMEMGDFRVVSSQQGEDTQ